MLTRFHPLLTTYPPLVCESLYWNRGNFSYSSIYIPCLVNIVCVGLGASSRAGLLQELTKNSCCTTSQYQILPEKSRLIFFYFILPSHSVTPFDIRWQICPTVHSFSQRYFCTLERIIFLKFMESKNSNVRTLNENTAYFFYGIVKKGLSKNH